MKIISKKQNDQNRVGNYVPVRSLFDDFFSVPSIMEDFFTRPTGISNLFADVWEEGDNVLIKMALPGVKKEDIKIEINADTITISGNTKSEERENSKKRYYFKSMESSFEQTFNLPAMVDANKADASYSDGVLKVVLPKAEQFKPKQLKVS